MGNEGGYIIDINIDILIEGMNNLQVYIDIDVVMKMLDDINKMTNELEYVITEMLVIKKYSEREVKSKLNLSEIKNDILVSKFNETNDEIYNEIIEYRKLNSKKKAIENILQNSIVELSLDKKINDSHFIEIEYSSTFKPIDIMSGYITPKFSVNVKNMISVAKPSLNFLSIELIEEITKSKSIIFENMFELLTFLNKFDVVLRDSNRKILYFVKGLILYFKVSNLIPLYVLDRFDELYNNKFPNELDALYGLARTQKKLLSTQSLTEKNYECFKEAWESYKYKLVLTLELKKQGYNDFIDFRNNYTRAEREVSVIKTFSQRRNSENKLIKLIKELKNFDNIEARYEMEAIDIVKEFKKLEFTMEEEINHQNEIFK